MDAFMCYLMCVDTPVDIIIILSIVCESHINKV